MYKHIVLEKEKNKVEEKKDKIGSIHHFESDEIKKNDRKLV